MVVNLEKDFKFAFGDAVLVEVPLEDKDKSRIIPLLVYIGYIA
jgi:hypothetical protein